MEEDRAITLLMATLDMLDKLDKSPTVQSPFEVSVFYDDAECDGTCLMDDIKSFLEQEGLL